MNKQIVIHLYNGHGLSNKNFTDTVISRKSQTQKNSHSLIIFVKKVQKYIVVSRDREKIHYCSGVEMRGED